VDLKSKYIIKIIDELLDSYRRGVYHFGDKLPELFYWLVNRKLELKRNEKYEFVNPKFRNSKLFIELK